MKSDENKRPLPTIIIADTTPNISFRDLFRFATKRDKRYIYLSFLCSVLAGATVQINSLCFGYLFEGMVQYGNSAHLGSARIEAFVSAIWKFTISVWIIGLALIFLLYVATALILIAAQNQVLRIRYEYFKAMIIQDIRFFELHGTGDFASRMLEDVNKIEEGIGDKLATFVYFQASCISSVLMAICRGWKLAFMCLISYPCIILLVGLAGWVANKFAVKECEAVGRASSVAHEALSSIRTVYAFNGQRKEVTRYHNFLIKACIYTKRKAFFTALAMGTLNICIYLTYSLTIRYGYNLIKNEPESYNVGNTLSIFLGIVSGSTNFGASLILMDVFGAARGAGAHLFELIDRKPEIHPFVSEGQVITSPRGAIEFNNVSFYYPSRPEAMVLNGISVKIKENQAAAFVGNSGCGKSTMIHLICRYYDVANGSVTLDGVDVRDLSVEWLRKRIGYVFSEVATFKASVRDNIRYGCESYTDDEVQAAAEKAYAHDFIMKLPMGYNTKLGEGGACLSGGQKQRIAIARALVRKPLLLLLDEATSQVDRISEDRLQRAIFEIKKKCTVVIVASLLSSIQYADIIHVMYDGKVVESGTHSQLIQLKGHYYHMIAFRTAPKKLQFRNDLFTKEPSDWQIKALSKLDEPDIDEEDDEDDDEDDESDEENDDIIDEVDSPPEIPTPIMETEKSYDASIKDVLNLSFPEWKTLALATICSCINGFGMPMLAIFVTSFMKNVYSPDSGSSVNFYSSMLLSISVMVGLSNFTAVYLFMTAGDRFTRRIKRMMFTKLLQQDIAFYDNRNNGSFALCARLSGQPVTAREVTGLRLGSIMQTMGTISLGVTLAFYYQVRIALFAVVVLPLMVMFFIAQGKMLANEASKASQLVEKSFHTAIEAVSNIQTINALGCEKHVINLYRSQLDEIFQRAAISHHYRGFLYGLSRGIVNFIYATAVLFAGYVIIYNDVDYAIIVKATQCLIMGVTTVGLVFSHAPNMRRGTQAAGKILSLLNSRPTIRDSRKPVMKNYISTGMASFKKVQFSYAGDGKIVLHGLNLNLQYGKTTAIIGINGNGKSTIIQLLERFYDPTSGSVCLDGIPLTHLRMSDIRQNIGLVQQESTLFHYRTVAENIAYGDNTRRLTMADIKTFAKQANIHEFIKSLPDGYNSKIGMKGTLLSGGQKQRIAIARALIREPALLILDEATSALDMESEKLVHQALQKARNGRTCLMVSHRLHTVQDADVIAVLHGGRIAELGTFDQLTKQRGIFHAMKYLENRHIIR